MQRRDWPPHLHRGGPLLRDAQGAGEHQVLPRLSRHRANGPPRAGQTRPLAARPPLPRARRPPPHAGAPQGGQGGICSRPRRSGHPTGRRPARGAAQASPDARPPGVLQPLPLRRVQGPSARLLCPVLRRRQDNARHWHDGSRQHRRCNRASQLLCAPAAFEGQEGAAGCLPWRTTGHVRYTGGAGTGVRVSMPGCGGHPAVRGRRFEAAGRGGWPPRHGRRVLQHWRRAHSVCLRARGCRVRLRTHQVVGNQFQYIHAAALHHALALSCHPRGRAFDECV
mmetsp:Transcript_16800/g.65617  ORF Transcript_16800/g.65617 Transcript_16800/m.65617 type:complete len:281 (+) Transcript_16800:1724-2566(+)